MSAELSLWIKKIMTLILIIWILYLGYRIWGIIFDVIISWFLTIIITPLVDKWEKYKIPSWLTLLWVYIIVILIFSIVIGTLIPIIISYVSDSISAIISWTNTAQWIYLQKWIHWFWLNPYIEKWVLFIFWENNIDNTLNIIKQNAGNIQTFITNQISSITSGGFTLVTNVGGVITEWFLIGITTFLMVLERKSIAKYIITSLPVKAHTYVEKHYSQLQNVFNSWIKWMLILSSSIAIITYIGLSLFEFFGGFSTWKTFTLALIWGIMEFIPYLGPILSLIPAVIIGLGISWKIAAGMVILYVCIQQTENNFLVPYIMSRSLDLSPFFVFIVMIIGGALGGILGIILAIPMAWAIRVIFEEYRKNAGSEKMTVEFLPRENLEKNLTKVKKLIVSKISSKK